MIIDFHTHVFPPDIKQNRGKYISADPHFAELYSIPKAKIATANELIASMDEDGVEISVILNFSWTTSELCTWTNDYILESVARYPKRLVGFGAIPPPAGKAAIAEVERCARGGLRGIGELRPDETGLDAEDDEFIAALNEVARKYRLILLTHASEPVGHRYPGKGGFTPDRLYRFITRFPDLLVVSAHWGGGLPFYALMPEVKETLGNVFFDTAASPFLYNPQIYHRVIPLVGADKILLGSDYPLLKPRRLIGEIKALNLPQETENLILAGNARRLLNI